MHDKAPKYLSDLTKSYAPGYSGLRSSTQELLKERNLKTQWGDRKVFGLQHQFYGTICHVM